VVAIDCPPEPWIAARLELGVGKRAEDAMMMIGIRKVIGWEFLERLDGGRLRRRFREGAPSCRTATVVTRGRDAASA